MTYFQDYTRSIQDLRKSGLKPLYLARGTEFLLFRKFSDAVVEKFREDQGAAGEIVQRWGPELREPNDLLPLISGGGLFNTASLLLIHGLENVGRGLKSDLHKYLSNLPPGTHVVAHYSGDNKRKAWLTKIQDMAHLVMVEQPFDSEMHTIVNRLASIRDYQLQRGAAASLIQMSGGDLSIIDQELEKIALYLNGSETTITEAHVNELSGLTERSKADDLLVAIDARDRVGAMQALKEIARQGNEGIPFLVVVIGNHMTSLRLQKDGSALPKGVRAPFAPRAIQQRLPRAAGLYSEEELEQALLSLSSIDRGTRLGTEEILTSFTKWVSEVL